MQLWRRSFPITDIVSYNIVSCNIFNIFVLYVSFHMIFLIKNKNHDILYINIYIYQASLRKDKVFLASLMTEYRFCIWSQPYFSKLKLIVPWKLVGTKNFPTIKPAINHSKTPAPASIQSRSISLSEAISIYTPLLTVSVWLGKTCLLGI